MTKAKFTVEAAFEELNGIIEKMEDPDLSLSDSMTYYKKGIKLLEKCSRALDQTEKEMIVLQEGQNDLILEGTDQQENQ